MSSAKGISLSELRARVLELDLAIGDYALFGSAPLLAHGLISRVNDIDILARGDAWTKMAASGAVQEAAGGDKRVRLAGGLEVFDGWLGLDVSGILARAELIGGLPYADLNDVLAFKRRLNRPKDRVHIRLLEARVGRLRQTPPA